MMELGNLILWPTNINQPTAAAASMGIVYARERNSRQNMRKTWQQLLHRGDADLCDKAKRQ